MDPNNSDVNTTPTEEPTTPSVEPTNTTPVTPVETTPEAPAAAPVVSAGAPAPQNSNGKKIALIAGIVGGVVILAIVGIIAFFLLNAVSKQDYRDAARQFNNVQSAGSSLTSDVSSLSYSMRSSDDGEFNNDISAVEDDLSKVKSENDKLANSKAVRVGEGAKLYGAFNDKLKAYTSNGTEIVDSVKKLRPAMLVCNKINSTTDNNARTAAVKSCSQELGKVGDVPNAAFNNYVKSLHDSYVDYATTYESIAALTNPYGSQYDQYKTLRDKMYAIQDKISAATKTFSSDLEKRDNEVSVKDSAQALADYLNKQQR